MMADWLKAALGRSDPIPAAILRNLSPIAAVIGLGRQRSGAWWMLPHINVDNRRRYGGHSLSLSWRPI